MSVIKMKYPLIQEMAQSFSQGKETTETVAGEINNIAQLLSQGALIGSSGEAFETACRTDLIPALQKLADKFEELNRDLMSSVEEMQSTDSETRQLF